MGGGVMEELLGGGHIHIDLHILLLLIVFSTLKTFKAVWVADKT